MYCGVSKYDSVDENTKVFSLRFHDDISGYFAGSIYISCEIRQAKTCKVQNNYSYNHYIILYFILVSQNSFFKIGFWVIMIHTIQLTITYLQRRSEN